MCTRACSVRFASRAHVSTDTPQPQTDSAAQSFSASFLLFEFFLAHAVVLFFVLGPPLTHSPLSVTHLFRALSLSVSLSFFSHSPPSLCTLGDARGGFDGVAFSLSLCLSLCLSSSQGGSGTVQTRVFHRATLRTSLPGRGLGGTTLVASEHTTRPAQVYFPKVTNDHK